MSETSKTNNEVNNQQAKQPTTYKIIKADTAHLLEILVNDYLANGWEPKGGVGVEAHPQMKPLLYQAVVFKS